MRERELFIEALQHDTPAARAAFLSTACAGDDGLRQRVERLLLEHERQESFILDALPPGIEHTVLDAPGEQPGAQIGPYKLLQQIGEGGMGVVYMAEQSEPVERRVALKIVKPGMDSRTVLARFDAERHALAVMDHPHIARVLDAGTTDSGRPYFVMELVKGAPITEYCDEHNLTPRERLELFIPVCEAVQHAHQKGIIHRDLKPSNVLVALYDDKPIPKVIDFGVAKATGRKLTEQTLFTEFGSIVGTLEYMSPEQANLNELDIDTRSDVYSLGVLLYELLTGTTPLQRKAIKDAAVLEMLRIVREVEPPKPSDRLTTTEELPSIAAHRGLEPKKLSGLVRGELDWIVMKCLEKERSRRYETANGLAMDLRRYLADEAVLACPPSRIYRLRKFARRNRPALVASAVLAGSLILGTAVSTWQAIRATSAERLAREQRELAETARQEAEAQRELAQENFRQARQAVDEYFTLVSESKLLDVPGLQPLRKQLLEAALRYYQDFSNQKSDDPQMLAELASSYLRVAMIDNAVSRNDDAVAALEQALTLVERLRRDYPHATEQHRALAGFWKGLRATQIVSGMPKDPQKARRVLARFADLWQAFIGENPTVTGFQSDLVALNGIQASLLNSLRQHGDTIILLQNSRLIGEKLVRDNPDVPEFRADLARTYDLLADALRVAGRAGEADQLRSQVLTLSEQAATHAAGTPQHQLDFARNLELLAARLRDRREFPQAEKTIRQSVEIFQNLVDEHPEAPLYHQRLHRAQTGLARLLSSTGRPAEAEAVLRIVLEGQANLLAKHAEQIEWASAREYTNSLVQLVSLLRSTGRVPEAETVIRQTIGHLERLTAEFADQPQVLELLAEAQLHYADFLAALDRPDEARAAYRACVEQRERVAREFPQNQIVNNLGHSYRIYAQWLNKLGQREEAEEVYRKAVAVFDRLAADNPDFVEYRHFSVDTRRSLGHVLHSLNRPKEAEDAFRRAFEIHEEREAERPGKPFNEYEVGDAFYDLARFLIEAGRSDEARDVCRRAIKVGAKNAKTLHDLALLLHGAGLPAEAEEAYRNALAAYRSLANDNRPDIARCLYDLARVLSEQTKYAEAEGLGREALTLRRQAHGDADGRVAGDLELLVLLFHKQNKSLEELVQSVPDAEAIWSNQTPEQLNGIAWRLVTDPDSGNRDSDLAVGLAKRAVARAPDQGYMVNTLGTAYCRAGEWQSAIETLKQADGLYQGQFFSSDAFFIAMSHWQLGAKDAALKWHNAAVRWMDKFAADNEEQKKFRDESAALLGLSDTESAAPDPASLDERAIYSLILDAWPEAAWAYLARARASKSAGESEQAQSDYRQALQVLDAAIARASDSAQPWIQRGHAHAMFDQWGEAANDLDKAVDLGAGPAVWYQAALARLGGNDTAGYHQACARISARQGELDTSDAAGLALWAYALAPDAAADLTPVIARAEKAVQENSQSLQRVNTLGALWYRAGRLDDALSTLTQADQLAQQPGSNSSPAYAWFFLAMTHHRRGNSDEATTWLAKARSATDEAFKSDQAGTARLPWNRRVTLSLLRSEAEALLGVK